MPGQDGQRQLLTMLSKTSEELGRDFPFYGGNTMRQSGKLKIMFKAGEGATSTVYVAKLGERQGVAKVMKRGFEHLASHEKGIVDHLKR